MESEREYLRRRAGEEQAAADRAASGKARDLHIELAARYRDAAEAKLVFVNPAKSSERVRGPTLELHIID